ncbi:hypothetical protein L916_06100 [Phytophthora nicotianae]|uniref:Uncharacterized protein n=1 Tax=Phytophthora nicotianae TaxID=4792 RepID=W2JAA9_PHYNI|nr:hypothetical protein L916_06100 [Phytophthora nicotianae]
MWDQNSFGFPNQPTSFVIDWAINSLDNTCLIAGSIRPYNGQSVAHRFLSTIKKLLKPPNPSVDSLRIISNGSTALEINWNRQNEAVPPSQASGGQNGDSSSRQDPGANG